MKASLIDNLLQLHLFELSSIKNENNLILQLQLASPGSMHCLALQPRLGGGSDKQILSGSDYPDPAPMCKDAMRKLH